MTDESLVPFEPSRAHWKRRTRSRTRIINSRALGVRQVTEVRAGEARERVHAHTMCELPGSLNGKAAARLWLRIAWGNEVYKRSQ